MNTYTMMQIYILVGLMAVCMILLVILAKKNSK